MAKWASAIFTDIRNKLANNVIFSTWKGRPYFRKYVKPANPKTAAQTAWRAKLKEIVLHYQTVAASVSDFERLWKAIGLEKLISGFNAYVGEAQKGKIKCPESAGIGAPFDVIYTLSFPAKYASLYARQVGPDTWTCLKSAGELTAGADQTVSVSIDSAGTYELWICDERALDPKLSSPKKELAMAVIHWDVDVEGGIVREALITIE